MLRVRGLVGAVGDAQAAMADTAAIARRTRRAARRRDIVWLRALGERGLWAVAIWRVGSSCSG